MTDADFPEGWHYDPDVDMSGYVPLSKRLKVTDEIRTYESKVLPVEEGQLTDAEIEAKYAEYNASFGSVGLVETVKVPEYVNVWDESFSEKLGWNVLVRVR